MIQKRRIVHIQVYGEELMLMVRKFLRIKSHRSVRTDKLLLIKKLHKVTFFSSSFILCHPVVWNECFWIITFFHFYQGQAVGVKGNDPVKSFVFNGWCCLPCESQLLTHKYVRDHVSYTIMYIIEDYFATRQCKIFPVKRLRQSIFSHW